jgi:predicted small integral membrane protein
MANLDTSPERQRSGIWVLGTLPVACTVVVAINALYILLVAIGNITDYHTNLDFVEHVLSMDTTNFGGQPGVGLDKDVLWRAITNPAIQNIAYIGVILWESLASIILLWAIYLWLTARRTRRFENARRMSTIGLLMVIILFMGGFLTVGGEWFEMWRSVAWNGNEPAFRNSVLALFGVLLCHIPSQE